VLSILITDSRHEPTELDLLMKEWLEARGKPLIIVATKADKLSSNQLRASMSRASAVLETKEIVAYSAVTRSGAARLWKDITSRIADRGSHIAD
jgi:GTP-binding protein